MLGISMPGTSLGSSRLARKRAKQIADRSLHRAEALRESVLPEAKERLEELQKQAAELRGQAQPVVDRALHRRQRRSRKPLLLLVLVAAAAAVAFYLLNRRDEHPAFLQTQPEEPDTAPDASPPDGGVESPADSTSRATDDRPVAIPTGAAAGATEVAATPTATAGDSTSRYNGAAPAGSYPSRGPAAWDLPSSASPPSTFMPPAMGQPR